MIHKYCFGCGSTVRLLVELYVDPDDIDDGDATHAAAMEVKHGETNRGKTEGRGWPEPCEMLQGFCSKCQKVVIPVAHQSDQPPRG